MDTFHAGEIALQQRTGAYERLAPRAALFIRDQMPEQHRELFEKLPTLLLGSVDADGRPWASVLVGRPGFVQATDARHLHIAAQPLAGDPLADSLQTGRPLGLLGLEPQTRRRNRMNGRVVALDGTGFTVQVDQSFGNCPQYIQARAPHWVDPAPVTPVMPVGGGGALAGEARALVARADTFFIASAVPGAVDVSHRGGKPGFVHIEEQDGRTLLTAPDFRGNFLFNTLGNITLNPRAGLLFVDHEQGHMLQLSGTAQIVWDGPLLRSFTGAERLLTVTVEHSRWWPAALPLRWSAPEQAPQLAATGSW